ncbi:type II secretion system secretin GspD [Silvimonas amylolytica]|uniref:Type IV pilus biogenesis and competence protein PilQ n=1 Tax=Silvimonas amylolytica TaxID=449663 RepID=A0ABQ2PHW7_9NEIS|nr:type II secretion system secretin GspD [Silvimonas amylolytica]GGP24910.1 type II secretion system protein GspD [Silvimonas amylolytica]
MKPRFRPLLIACLLASQLLQAADNTNSVTLNFVNADLESTIKAVGLITGKNFVIDPRVKGTVNIVSSEPVAKEAVYPILLSALRQQGFTALEANGVVKVMPEADAKQNYSTTGQRGMKLNGDKIVTQVYPLRYESATQLVPILRPLVSPNNTVAAYPAGNTLVITDYADNVRRLNRIIESIDQPAQSDIFPIQLKYASALDVAQTLARLMPEISMQGVTPANAPGEGIHRSTIVPDVRSNALLVRSENQATAQQIKRLVDTLDQPGAAGGNIHVVYLRNAEATKLAGTLKGILTGQDSGNGSNSNQSTSLAASASLSSNSSTSSSSTSNTGLSGMSSTPTTTTTSNTSTQPTSTSVQVGGANVLITADPMTNSMIITAPDNIYNNLRDVIDKLDARRAQVYVEAIIAEVNASKLNELGVQWQLGLTGSGTSVVGLSALTGSVATLNNPITSILSGISTGTFSTTPSGFNLGVVNGSATAGVILSALENSGDANVLSTPNLVTLDNEEAKIMVGQNIPILTGQTASTGSNTNPFNTYTRQDIGITLAVRPQVSEGGTITMQVYQEVSSIDSTVNTNGGGIATKKRTIDSKVLVDNGQTIVLGGLLQDSSSNGENKVPLLGDIPVIGGLFRYQSRNWAKTDLMVFLRPVILYDSKDTDTLSADRYGYLRRVQQEFKMSDSVLLKAVPNAVLPDLSSTPTTPSTSRYGVQDMRGAGKQTTNATTPTVTQPLAPAASAPAAATQDQAK